MAANLDVTELSAVNALASLEGIYDEINGIRDVCRNNSSKFDDNPMKLCEKIYRLCTEFIGI